MQEIFNPARPAAHPNPGMWWLTDDPTWIKRIGLGMILAILAGWGFGYWYWQRPAESKAAPTSFDRAWVERLEREYRIVLNHGNDMDICIHARAVAEAYLTIGDEPHYVEWNLQSNPSCKAAGIPIKK